MVIGERHLPGRLVAGDLSGSRSQPGTGDDADRSRRVQIVPEDGEQHRPNEALYTRGKRSAFGDDGGTVPAVSKFTHYYVITDKLIVA